MTNAYSAKETVCRLLINFVNLQRSLLENFPEFFELR